MTRLESTQGSSGSSILPLFSHLYVESDLRGLPETEAVLSRFPKARVVEIETYQEVVQRRSASWNDQKRSPKLVVARKRSELIYPCSDVAPDFGHENFYYAVPMQNCLYDCEYCYLQGMYTSANLVYFVNQREMIEAAVARQRELGDLYLCIAYDNDILAVENLFGVAAAWVEGVRDHPRLTVEIRTKSGNFRPLAGLPPAESVILAWTLSPTAVIERFEQKTPPLEVRLKALEQALERGWRVRLCFDPLLPVAGWRQAYMEMFQRLDCGEIWPRVQDVSYGLFRMPKPFLRQAKKARPDSALLHNAQSREGRGLYTLTGTDQETLLEFVEAEVLKRLDQSKVWRT